MCSEHRGFFRRRPDRACPSACQRIHEHPTRALACVSARARRNAPFFHPRQYPTTGDPNAYNQLDKTTQPAELLRQRACEARHHVALDLISVVVVAVLSIAVNIVLAVFIGVAIAIALFVLRMSRSVIRRSYRCGVIHSRRARMASQRIFLEQAGDAILVMELQGALFFGTGEKILSEADCFVLTMSNFTALTEKNPSVAVRILAAIGRELSARLRTANRTIHQLET
jgi:hypothetical protein